MDQNADLPVGFRSLAEWFDRMPMTSTLPDAVVRRHMIDYCLAFARPRHERSVRVAYALWAVASAAAMFIIVATSSRTEAYDEPAHMGLTRLVQHMGLREALLSPNNQSAAGPLFPVVHCALGWVTGGRPPYTRFVNIAFLIASIGLIYSTLAAHTRFAREAATSLLAVPQLWKCAGMAMTEMPALFFFTLFIVIFLRAMHRSVGGKPSAADGVLAGISLGIAILGRQTYLAAAAPIIFIGAVHRPLRLQAAITLLSCGVVCGWLFLLWGGLVPPSQRFVDSGWNPAYGFLSFGYMGVASFLLCPQRYLTADRKSLLLALAIGVGATFIGWIPLPGHGTLVRLMPVEVALGIGAVCAPLFSSVGTLWAVLLVKDLVRCRRSPEPSFVLMTTLVLAIAPAKVSHLFSSRYTVNTIGAECSRNTGFEPSWLHLGVLVCGSIAGALSLSAHYAV